MEHVFIYIYIYKILNIKYFYTITGTVIQAAGSDEELKKLLLQYKNMAKDDIQFFF